MPDFFALPRPRLFAHRGDSHAFPENTLPAFDAAVRAGIVYIETDVQCTRDGVIVISHDPTVERLTNAPGAIADMMWEDLRRLDAGHAHTPDGGRSFPFRGRDVRYASLEEALKTFSHTCFNIDIKTTAPLVPERVVQTVRAAQAGERVCVAAFHDRVLHEFRRRAPEIRTSLATQETFDFLRRYEKKTWDGYAPAGRALQVPPRFGGRDVVTPEFLAAAHAAGLEIHVWTINDPAEMRALIARGVDGLMTDDPDTLLRIARDNL